MRGGLPVLGASAEVDLYLPGEDLGQSLGDGLVHKITLRDDGLGKWSHIGTLELLSDMVMISSVFNFSFSHEPVQMVNLDKNVSFSCRRWLAVGSPPESLLQDEKLLGSNGLLVSQHKSSLYPCKNELSYAITVSQPIPSILYAHFYGAFSNLAEFHHEKIT